MRDVLGGTLWDSPAWEQVLGGYGMGPGGLLAAAEPVSPQIPPARIWGCGGMQGDLHALRVVVW